MHPGSMYLYVHTVYTYNIFLFLYYMYRVLVILFYCTVLFYSILALPFSLVLPILLL